jgi:predicted heme/steroid binding protein
MRKLLSSRLAALSSPEVASAAAALALRGWWEEVNDSPAWQDGAFFSLSAAYALVSAVALVRPPAGPCSNPL